MPTTETILSTVKAEMARRNIKQGAIAECLGVSVAAVSDRLRGHTPLRVDELVRIAELLGVDVSVLVADLAQAS